MEKLLSWSNGVLLGFVIALLISVVLAYPLAEALPMPLQITAHIATMIFAIGIKLSYIARLASLKALGRPVH